MNEQKSTVTGTEDAVRATGHSQELAGRCWALEAELEQLKAAYGMEGPVESMGSDWNRGDGSWRSK